METRQRPRWLTKSNSFNLKSHFLEPVKRTLQ